LEQFRIIDGTSILQLWSKDVKKYAERNNGIKWIKDQPLQPGTPNNWLSRIWAEIFSTQDVKDFLKFLAFFIVAAETSPSKVKGDFRDPHGKLPILFPYF